MQFEGMVVFHDHDFSWGDRKPKLKDIDIHTLSRLLLPVVEKAEFAIYKGELGSKVLKSRFSTCGVVLCDLEKLRAKGKSKK